MTPEIDAAKSYLDFRGFDQLRQAAREDQDQALEKVAKQFESLFLHMMMKSMRDAQAAFKSDNFLRSDTTDFYEGMFDQQMALTLSQGKSLGLSDILVRQLGKNPDKKLNGKAENMTLPVAPTTKNEKTAAPEAKLPQKFTDPVEFVKALWPQAKAFAKKLNLDPKMLLAQAALETGWGKAILQHFNGNSSYNLFNIKADKSWEAERVVVPALEYEAGIAVKRHEPFRSYGSYAESFADYVNFLKTNMRYEKALQQTDNPDAFIQALQEAGYATDPNYAEKIKQIYQSDVFSQALQPRKP